MKTHRFLLTLATMLMALLVAQDRSEDLYQRAKQALDQSRWPEAANLFQQAADAKGRRSDGALYWKAWAQRKQGAHSEALATLRALRAAYPESRWLNDAKALELEIRQESGQTVSPANQSNDDLKLIAINSLMHADPESAVPMLEKFLQGNHSAKLKEKALFVLAQSRSPRAREVIGEVARGGAHPELQNRALEYLGLFGGSESRKLLADIYASSSDVKVKSRILQSFMLAGERDRILIAAKSEKTPELRRKAVQLLGVMGAREELWQMYGSETSYEVKRQIMESLFVAGARDRMQDLARSEKNPELRRKAIEKLGLMGAETAPALIALYAESDRDNKDAVLNALFLQGNAKALIEIARKETDADLKKRAVQKLALMGSKEARDFMLEILNQ